MKRTFRLTWTRITIVSAAAVFSCGLISPAAAATAAGVDFRYSPPEWQTAICLPDDAHKSLVDRSGELLYHYGQGGREFATRIGVEVAGGAVWQNTRNCTRHACPSCGHCRTADGLEIMEEAFVDGVLHRLDAGPPAGRALHGRATT